MKVDVIVSGSTSGVLATKKATTTISIVFASVFDPVGSGVVTSLARPEGNVTGVSIGISRESLGGKWAQLLKDIEPNVAPIALLHNSANPSGTVYVRETQASDNSGVARQLARFVKRVLAFRSYNVIQKPSTVKYIE